MVNRDKQVKMRSKNKFELIGHLGAKPTATTLDGGLKKVEITIATSEKYTKKATGETVEKTEWHRCVAFGKTAEIIEQYMDKGMKVLIEGKLTYSNYDDKDGKKVYVTNLNITDFMFLSGKGESGSTSNQPETPPVVVEGNDDDLPF